MVITWKDLDGPMYWHNAYCIIMHRWIIFCKPHISSEQGMLTRWLLWKLQEDAFMHTKGAHSDKAKRAWRQEMIKKSPTFQYWDTILNMELLGLIFISHCEGHFSLYVESLKSLVPWFFAFLPTTPSSLYGQRSWSSSWQLIIMDVPYKCEPSYSKLAEYSSFPLIPAMTTLIMICLANWR